MSNPLKKLAGQTVIYGLGTIVPRFLNYFLTPVLTYAFSPKEFAINSELFAYISFLNVVFSYGMETAFFNFYNKQTDKITVINTATLSLISTSVVLGLVLLLLAPFITTWLSTPTVVYQPEFVYWSILVLVSEAICIIPFATLRVENKALKFSFLKLSNVIINTGIVVFYVLVCRPAFNANANTIFASLYKPEIGIGYVFLAGVIANVFTLLLLIPEFRKLQFKVDKVLLNQMWRYGWPVLIMGLGAMVNDTFDRIFIKWLIADKEAAQLAQGIYGACYKVAILMTIFTTAFRFAAEPFFFSKAKDKNSKKLYALVMKYFVIFCSFLFLATMVNMDWIQYFVGKDFREGLKVVPVLLMAYLFLGVVYNLSIWYKLSQQTKFGAVITLVGAAITLVINIVFVPYFSYMACAWATFFAFGSMMVISYRLGQKHFPIKYNLKAMSVYFGLALFLYLFSKLFSGIEIKTLRFILNNMLVVFYLWVFYKLDSGNLKRIHVETL